MARRSNLLCFGSTWLPRRGMASITKDHARAIAKKLRATVNAKSKAHDAAVVYDD
jgi:hypothetical protein